MAVYTKKSNTNITVTGEVIDADQTLTNCEGVVFGGFVYGLTGSPKEADFTLKDSIGRDVLNGQGKGITSNKVQIMFDDIGGTLVFDETLTFAGTAKEDFKFDLFLRT